MESQERILIVDDDPSNLSVLRYLLADEYHLMSAESGEECLELAETFQPDLILLDIVMPGIGGLEACRRLRQNRVLRHTKIILNSGKDQVEERLAGYDAGADDYIVKPYDEEELLAKVRVFLRLKSSEEVSQLKTDLLALISHEINTPLNGLLAPARMLQEDDLDPEERQMWASIVGESATRIHLFFKKALLLNQLSSGEMRLDFKPTNLTTIAEKARYETASLAEEREVQINLEGKVKQKILIDRKHILTAVLSVLENAVRFSPVGANVDMELSEDKSGTRLSITDRGAGIPAELRPHVFDPFHDPNIRHHADGSRLSLAIARHVVAAHRGSLRFQSEYGAGTTFIIELPHLPEDWSVNAPAPDALGALS